MPMKKHLVQHFVLSDGLAMVSVYIEKSLADEQALEGESSMGSVNAYGRRVDGHRVTVMGEVPKATVKQIAEAVARKRCPRLPLSKLLRPLPEIDFTDRRDC
jgi:negative regulator of sigma E activity